MASRLRADGVDVLLDVWDFKEGQDKHTFMEKMVLDATVSKVLVLVDRQYADKADSKTGGVGTETQIISSELYAKVEQTKFIPIVLEHDENGPILPVFLKSRKYIDFSPLSTIDHYQYLVRLLFNKPLNEKPPLGKPPQYLETNLQPKTRFLSETHSLKKVVSSNSAGSITATSKSIYRDLAKEIISAEILTFQKENHDEEVLDSIHDLKVVQNSFLETTSQLIDFDPNAALVSIREYFEPLLKAYQPTSNPYKTYQTDNIAFIAQESLLILGSLLIKTEAFSTFGNLTRTYLLSSKNSQIKNVLITDIYKNLPSLEQLRNQRLNLNRISVTADILKERADSSLISFEDMISTDLVLFLRALFKGDHWVPRTIVYKSDYDSTELFIRAESSSYLKGVLSAFDMYSTEEFKKTFEEAKENYRLSNYRISSNSWPVNFKNLINYEKLGTLK
nr:SEFIR domain-containing protein [Bdellovibrio sp. HAGR004]